MVTRSTIPTNSAPEPTGICVMSMRQGSLGLDKKKKKTKAVITLAEDTAKTIISCFQVDYPLLQREGVLQLCRVGGPTQIKSAA